MVPVPDEEHAWDMFLRPKKTDMITIDKALTGRPTEMPVADRHTVLGTPLRGPWPAGLEVAYFGLGLLLGRGAHVLEGARCLLHLGGLPGRVHREPDV